MDKVQVAVNVLDLLVVFKRKDPKDYEEIFKILGEALEIYEENPKVKSSLKNFLAGEPHSFEILVSRMSA